MTEFLFLAAILLTVSISAFAGSALARLLVEEEGPFDILKKFRRLIGITEEIEDRIIDGDYKAREEINVIGRMFTCVTCSTTAITIGLASACIFFPPVIKVVAIFSAVGLALKINE